MSVDIPTQETNVLIPNFVIDEIVTLELPSEAMDQQQVKSNEEVELPANSTPTLDVVEYLQRLPDTIRTVPRRGSRLRIPDRKINPQR